MKKSKLLILLIIPLVFTGCWDKIEIDRKLFISTIAIDLGKESSKTDELKDIKIDEPFQERQLKKFNIIYAFPDISKLSPGNTEGASLEKITTEAYSMEDGVSQALTKSSRSIYFGHSKLLLISNEIFLDKDLTKEIFDYLERKNTLNRMMYVLICNGKVEDYIDFKPEMETNIENYISGLMQNSSKNATILPVTLNELLILLRDNSNALIPEITLDKEKNELYLSGVQIIKDYVTVGTLNPIEVSDLEILRGKIKSGEKVIYVDGHPLDFEINGINRSIKVDYSNDKLISNINIILEGQIKGYYFDENVYSEEFIDSAEEAFNKSLSEECAKVAKITQTEFGVDPLKLQENLEKFHPIIWKKVKGDWEKYYINSEINVNIKTKIRRIGAIK